MESFWRPPLKPAMIWKCSPCILEPLSSKWPNGSPPFNAPTTKGSRFSLCALIRPGPSPNGTLPRSCNLPVTGALVPCGMSMQPLKHLVDFCDSWPKRPMGCAISALLETCPNPVAVLAHPPNALRLVSGVKSAMPKLSSMPMIWMSKTPALLNLSACPAGPVSGPIATNARSRR